MIEVRAHAKVNLGLAVTARRDDGYHDLDTIMARLDLHDTVELEVIPRGIEFSAGGVPVPTDATNLVVRAARAYLAATDAGRGVRVTLTKRIPVAAGLGGGSSDAAATLRGLERLLPPHPGRTVDLAALALEIGSDVPFFLSGLRAARARGRGERLLPLELPPLHVVLVNPGIHVSAGDAYRALASPGPELDVDAVARALRAQDDPPYRNDLEPGVLELEHAVRDVLDVLRDAGLRGVLMSGSGSTCFGIARDEQRARAVTETIRRAAPGWWTRATRLG